MSAEDTERYKSERDLRTLEKEKRAKFPEWCLVVGIGWRWLWRAVQRRKIVTELEVAQNAYLAMPRR